MLNALQNLETKHELIDPTMIAVIALITLFASTLIICDVRTNDDTSIISFYSLSLIRLTEIVYLCLTTYFIADISR